MDVHPAFRRYNASDCNDVDTIDLVDKRATGPSIKNGTIKKPSVASTKPPVANARDKRASNVHTLNDAREKRAANAHTNIDQSSKADRATSSMPPKMEGVPHPSDVYSYIEERRHSRGRPIGFSPLKIGEVIRTPEVERGTPLPVSMSASDDSIKESEKSGSLSPPLGSNITTLSQGFQADRTAFLAQRAAQHGVDIEHYYSDSSSQPSIIDNIEEVPEPVDAMNPDSSSKSAAKDSRFPCTFKGCDRGFAKCKDLKRHKKADHEWCEVCDLDFENDRALVDHKKEVTIAAKTKDGGKHNACLVCGEDFMCIAGRVRHAKLAHPEVQDIRCPGCSESFTRGAALLAHVVHNRCKDRSGVVSMTNFRTGRINAALELDQLLNPGNGAESRTQQTSKAPSTINNDVIGSVAPSLMDGDGDGGVPIQHSSLIDKCGNWIENNEQYCNNASEFEGPGDYEALSDNGTATSSRPRPVSEVLNEAQKKQNAMKASMQNMSIAENSKAIEKGPWNNSNKDLFPGAKPTPNTFGWTAPQRRAPAPPRRIPATVNEVLKMYDRATNKVGLKVDCDWDVFKFDIDVMGRVKCPFQRCHMTYPNVGAVKTHLISGYHDTSDDRCVKCLRSFKGAVGLLAHMESASTTCNIRDTEQYGHLIYMVSGGLVDVNDDEKGVSLPDGTLRMRAPTKEELIARQEANEEAERERERQRAKRLEAEW